MINFKAYVRLSYTSHFSLEIGYGVSEVSLTVAVIYFLTNLNSLSFYSRENSDTAPK